jgi:hypothetical protein
MRKDTLPAFIIGGAPRSGTTYLATGLARHPQVRMAQPLIPEPKVFMTYDQPATFYIDRYRALFDGASDGTVCGEKTSYYLESSQARDLIYRILPDVRLLFIVREPVARAYSNYLWTRKNGLETLSFEDAIAAEGRRASPLPPDKAYVRPFDYLSRSHYALLARSYLNVFGQHRVRFILYEDIALRPARLWDEIQQYLGLTPVGWNNLDAGVVNSAKDTGDPIGPETAIRLRERMQPLVDEFRQLTGLDLSSWRYAA